MFFVLSLLTRLTALAKVELISPVTDWQELWVLKAADVETFLWNHRLLAQVQRFVWTKCQNVTSEKSYNHFVLLSKFVFHTWKVQKLQLQPCDQKHTL